MKLVSLWSSSTSESPTMLTFSEMMERMNNVGRLENLIFGPRPKYRFNGLLGKEPHQGTTGSIGQ